MLVKSILANMLYIYFLIFFRYFIKQNKTQIHFIHKSWCRLKYWIQHVQNVQLMCKWYITTIVCWLFSKQTLLCWYITEILFIIAKSQMETTSWANSSEYLYRHYNANCILHLDQMYRLAQNTTSVSFSTSKFHANRFEALLPWMCE